MKHCRIEAKKNRHGVGVAILIGLGLAGCTRVDPVKSLSEIPVEPDSLGRIERVSSFAGMIYLTGQPSAGDFAVMADRGIKIVINLRTEREMNSLSFNEKEVAEAAGLTYVSVPIGGEGLDNENIEKIEAYLEQAGQNPVLLHCGSANRVGYIWSMFRATRHGLAAEDAIAEAKRVGLRAPSLEKNARSFIARHRGP